MDKFFKQSPKRLFFIIFDIFLVVTAVLMIHDLNKPRCLYAGQYAAQYCAPIPESEAKIFVSDELTTDKQSYPNEDTNDGKYSTYKASHNFIGNPDFEDTYQNAAAILTGFYFNDPSRPGQPGDHNVDKLRFYMTRPKVNPAAKKVEFDIESSDFDSPGHEYEFQAWYKILAY